MRIAVIIPAYKVKSHILHVLSSIEDNVDKIYVVDDHCPEESGKYVVENSNNKRVDVIFHEKNTGVGGAMKSGYKRALKDGIDIVVKIDGDGQMDPKLVTKFLKPITSGIADYTKGNRFYSYYNVRKMPSVRLFGNAVLSFLTKISSGYYRIFDPTNGYTAIHTKALGYLNFDNISDRYFFESDMLINLGSIKAVVVDIPMEAVYGDEESSLKISNVMSEFLFKNIKESIKRIVYNYILRDFNVASLQLLMGTVSLMLGSVFGMVKWYESIQSQIPATSGSVMLSALPIIIGVQLIGGFIAYDVSNQPEVPLQRVDDE